MVSVWVRVPLKIRMCLQSQQTSNCGIQHNCCSHMRISMFCNQLCLEFSNGGLELSISLFGRQVTKLCHCGDIRGHRLGMSAAIFMQVEEEQERSKS